jgi:site-specific DNA-methyltransferase (adenine-specific)/modification methylase
MSAILKKEVIGGQTLILGDCLSIMPELGRFDAVVTDPPYGINAAKNGWIGGDNKAPVKDYGAKGWDASPASLNHIAAMLELSNHQIIFGGNYFYGLGPTSCWLVWDKQNTGGFADCELAWTNLPKAVRRIYWRWNGMIRKGDDGPRQHPTQKPVGVMEWCIGHLPDDAQTILDPFMGSGTTLVACQRLGRNGTGIELDPDYFQIACERVHEAWSAPDLFIEPPKAEPVEQFNLLDGDAA